MPEVIEGTGIFDRIPSWGELDDALIFFDVSIGRFAEQTGMARRRLQRFLETEDPVPGWVPIVLMMYERFPELRNLSRPPDVDGMSHGEAVTPELLGAALRRREISPETFTRHLRLASVAVEHMLDGSRPELRPWIRWVLLMYDLCPKTRSLAEPMHLPLDKWPEPPDEEG